MENTIIIEVNKDGKYKGTSFSDRVTDEEAENLAIEANEKENFKRYFIIRDRLIIDALRAKETSESMQFYAKQIKERLKDFTDVIEERIGDLESFRDCIETYLKENKELKAGAN